MKRYLAILLALLVLAVLACSLPGGNAVRGSGDVVQEERSVGSFGGIQLSNQGDVIIELGAAEALIVEAEENLLEYLVTEVRGDTLYLGTKSGTNLNNSEPIRYYVTVRALENIQISSSGDVTSPALAADNFLIQVSGSGNADIAGLEADRLAVNVSSSGDVVIGGGEVDGQEITLGSSGEYDSAMMDSREAEVNISSSGDATIRVSDTLEANLSSSGDVYYSGDPLLYVTATSSGRAIKQFE